MSFLSRFFGPKDEDDDTDANLEVGDEDEGLFMATGPQGAFAGDRGAPAPEQLITQPNQPVPDEFAPGEPADAADVQTAEPLEPEAEAADTGPVEVGAEPQPEAELEATDEVVEDEPAAEAAEGPAEDGAAEAEEPPEAEAESGAEENSGDDDPLAAFRGVETKGSAGRLLEGMDDVSAHELLETAREVRDMLPAGGTNGSSEQPSE